MSFLQESLYFGFVISLAASGRGMDQKEGGMGYIKPASGFCGHCDRGAEAFACGLCFL